MRMINYIHVHEILCPFPFSLLLFAKKKAAQQSPPSHKKRAFLFKKKKKGNHLGKAEASGMFLDFRVNPSLFSHTEKEKAAQLFYGKKEGKCQRKKYVEIKDMACLTQRCLEMINL